MVNLSRTETGDLMVTKSFENGETELLTISNTAAPAAAELPDGFIDVTPGDDSAPGIEQQLSAGGASSSIVESAALGGDSLDALLRG